MGQQPRELTPQRSPQHHWGAELRSWREHRGLSVAELGRRIHLNGSYIAKIERAERPSNTAFAQSCDRVLDAGGALTRLHTLVVDLSGPSPAAGPDGAGDVASSGLDVATSATGVVSAEGEAGPWGAGGEVTVPARTPDGRIIFVSVSRRIFLQGLGTVAAAGAADPPVSQIPAASFAGARNRQVAGGNPVTHFREMRDVLIDSDNLFGPARVISTVKDQLDVLQQLRLGSRGEDHRQLTYVQTQYAEFAGWLSQDLGDHRAAQYWTDRALEWSHTTGDVDLTVFILARKSQLAGDMAGSPVEAINLAEAAMRMAAPRSRLAVVAATYAAHGYALDGDHAGCAHAYDRAHDLLGRMDDQGSPWAAWLDNSYLEVQRARSLATLGDYVTAAAGFQTAIAALPAGYHRDRGVYLAREALAHAGAHDAERAADLGLQALTIGADTNSGRILSELTRLEQKLVPWGGVAGVVEFRDAMADTIVRQV